MDFGSGDRIITISLNKLIASMAKIGAAGTRTAIPSPDTQLLRFALSYSRAVYGISGIDSVQWWPFR